MIHIEERRHASVPAFALFQYGFRPFFLFAAAHAAVSIFLWVAVWHGGLTIASPLPVAWWHGHEMVFGFGLAAVAGFLLTAVPNWTAVGPVRGGRLFVLWAVWLAARVLAWGGEGGAWLFAVIDLAFLPLLATMVAPSILVRSAKRNGVFLAMLALLFVANLAYHGDALGWPVGSAPWGLRLAIGGLLLMIAVVGGRIVPAFTIGGMRMAGAPLEIAPAPRLDMVAILSLAAVVALEAGSAAEQVVGAAAAVACVAHAMRLVRWQGSRTWRVPLVWILHVGYAWLPVGLGLKALGAWTPAVPATASLHALTAGTIATMILAVMSRASLGHTGRALQASRAVTLAYGLVTLGAVLRVVAPFTPVELALIALGGSAWALGFAVFAVAYMPILVGPRADGRPG